MDNLLQNRLFLQYLAAAGQDIGSGNPIGTNVNAVTQQNIGAQSQAKLNEHYMKMLASILKGEVPAGGKMTMDETGTKFQIPHPPKSTGLANEGFNSAGTSMNMGAVNAPTGQYETNRTNYLNSILNPSDSQPGITGADLAGLGPQDVSRALSGALDVQALMQQIPALQADVLYKRAAAHAALNKDERTAAQKNFEYARSQGYAGSFDEWEKDAKTIFQKDYEYDVKHDKYKGGFHKWMLERQKSGATRISIGEKVETKRALDEVAAQSSVTDPKLTEKIESKLKRADVYFDNADSIEAFAKQYNITSEQATDIYYKAAVREKIDGMIKQAYKDKDVSYVKGKGWYADKKLIRRDPYASQ